LATQQQLLLKLRLRETQEAEDKVLHSQELERLRSEIASLRKEEKDGQKQLQHSKEAHLKTTQDNEKLQLIIAGLSRQVEELNLASNKSADQQKFVLIRLEALAHDQVSCIAQKEQEVTALKKALEE